MPDASLYSVGHKGGCRLMPAIIPITTACKCTYCVSGWVGVRACVRACVRMYVSIYVRVYQFSYNRVLIYSDFRQNAKRITEYN